MMPAKRSLSANQLYCEERTTEVKSTTMCEILVYDPEELSTDDAFDVSFDMYQSNNDGLGALAVYKEDEQFSYEPFAQADPSFAEFMNFLMQHEDSAWRIILHARLSTTGEHTDPYTHPLEVGEGADFDWVIHNGVVTNHSSIRNSAEAAGHSYATDVDSESIAHCVEELPETTDDIDTEMEYRLAGRLNYILCNEDGIFIHNTGKYEWTEDFTMTRCYRKLSFEGGNDSIKWMILKPDDTVQTIEQERVTTTRSRGGSYWSGAGGNRTTQSQFQQGKSEESSSGASCERNPESVDDLPDDLGVLFNDDGELIAYWDEDELEKYTSDYDEYKEEYGEGNGNKVVVYGDELNASHPADDRVPDNATGMYISEDGTRIDWWEMGEVGSDVEHGTVKVDDVVLEVQTKDLKQMFNEPVKEKLGNGTEKSNESGTDFDNKSGNIFADDEALEMWGGHFGPEPASAD